MFKPDRVDPETGRSRYLPDQAGWDVEEAADVADVFAELRAMSGYPVDVEISRRHGPAARLEARAVASIVEDTIEGPGFPDQGVRIEVKGVDPIVLSEGEFVRARISPGVVEATFRHLEILVSRVSLNWWRVAG